MPIVATAPFEGAGFLDALSLHVFQKLRSNFCLFDMLPKVVMRVDPDEEFIKALDCELQIFNYFIERAMEKICATNELRIHEALKAVLCASLEIAP
jgi:hypothetical protein